MAGPELARISRASTERISIQQPREGQVLPQRGGAAANLIGSARRAFFNLLSSVGQKLNPAQICYRAPNNIDNTKESSSLLMGKVVLIDENGLLERGSQNLQKSLRTPGEVREYIERLEIFLQTRDKKYLGPKFQNWRIEDLLKIAKEDLEECNKFFQNYEEESVGGAAKFSADILQKPDPESASARNFRIADPDLKVLVAEVSADTGDTQVERQVEREPEVRPPEVPPKILNKKGIENKMKDIFSNKDENKLHQEVQKVLESSDHKKKRQNMVES
ncbi:hypothetical protein [Microbulbifer sp. JMSA003]|uniref:hypothetical protein n=1 Tax=unclassified Microbulbifer TaxID=2619833 RepID=UPI00403A10C4